jgi:pre-mRNA-splicing factor CWC26
MIDEDAIALEEFASTTKHKRQRIEAESLNENNNQPKQKRRLDSSSDDNSDDDSDDANNDSDDASPPRRGAGTSSDDDDDSDAAPRRRGGGSESDDDGSDSDAAPPRRGDSESSSSSSTSLSGLISSTEFQKSQEKIAKKKAKELARLEKERKTIKDGKHNKVINRDGQGNIINFQKKKKEREQAKKQEEHLWTTGKAQRENLLQQFEHMKKMASAPFAQDANNSSSTRDHELKNRIRMEDPMAQFHDVQEDVIAENINGERRKKKMYRGPPGPSNRFNIKPGYRWDGVNRGIGFEAKIIEYLRKTGKMR